VNLSAALHEEDDRARRRDRACMTSGALTGAGTGVLAAALTGPSGLFLGLVGALAGGIIGRLVANHISADEWDPLDGERPYVGTNSPDDDIE
jgi:hypothetical protein